jgi:hypothetical protein
MEVMEGIVAWPSSAEFLEMMEVMEVMDGSGE